MILLFYFYYWLFPSYSPPQNPIHSPNFWYAPTQKLKINHFFRKMMYYSCLVLVILLNHHWFVLLDVSSFSSSSLFALVFFFFFFICPCFLLVAYKNTLGPLWPLFSVTHRGPCIVHCKLQHLTGGVTGNQREGPLYNTTYNTILANYSHPYGVYVSNMKPKLTDGHIWSSQPKIEWSILFSLKAISVFHF